MRTRLLISTVTTMLGVALAAFAQDAQKPDPPTTKPAERPADSQPASKPSEKGTTDARPADVGKPAPDFSLVASDGKTYKLADFKNKTLVLEWISKDCPTCIKLAPKLKATAVELDKKGVAWLGIDSSHYRKSEDNKKFVADEKLPYPILEDFDGKIGRAYGAKVTPHIFVIHKGTLVYSGALVKVAEERNYVKEAVEAILAGKEPPLQTTKPYG